MKFEEFDFKRAINSDKAMNAIANVLALSLWALFFVVLAYEL